MSIQAKTKSRKVGKLFGVALFTILMLCGTRYAYAEMTCAQTGHQGDCYTYSCINGWGGHVTFTCCGANICGSYGN